MKKYVIIVGGGKGTRMGNNLPKQFLPIAGKPLLMHTLEKFNRWDPKAELVLVLPESYRSYWEMLCREIGCKVKHRLVTGGETRFYSVKNGLESIYAEINASSEKALIGVHDGVRPFVSEQVIAECFRIADEKGAAIPTLPVIDSLREIQSDGSSRAIDRSLYYAVHTPQVRISYSKPTNNRIKKVLPMTHRSSNPYLFPWKWYPQTERTSKSRRPLITLQHVVYWSKKKETLLFFLHQHFEAPPKQQPQRSQTDRESTPHPERSPF